MTAASFLDAVRDRRTIYHLNKSLSISEARVTEIVYAAAKYCPSCFNVQSTRVLVLLNGEHERLWDVISNVLLPKTPQGDELVARRKKLGLYRQGYGTVLFFEDTGPIEQLQEQNPVYSQGIPQWADQGNAMHQYIVWTALEAEGLGCHLQHYEQFVEAEVRREWDLDPKWKLGGQLVFGGISNEPEDKKYLPLSPRVLVRGAESG